MVIPKEEKDKCGIEDVGIYALTNLVIRSPEAINLENVNAQSTLDFCFFRRLTFIVFKHHTF